MTYGEIGRTYDCKCDADKRSIAPHDMVPVRGQLGARTLFISIFHCAVPAFFWVQPLYLKRSPPTLYPPKVTDSLN
jgi:hypothetical protein